MVRSLVEVVIIYPDTRVKSNVSASLGTKLGLGDLGDLGDPSESLIASAEERCMVVYVCIYKINKCNIMHIYI